MTRAATALPQSLDQAFAAVAGELGMASAAWLFVRAVARHEGDDGVAALSDGVGATFPVVEAVARLWREGTREPRIDADPVMAAIGRANKIVIVGLEAPFIDALVARASPETRIALVTHSPFDVDFDRVLDNWNGRVERVDLDTFQHYAGHKSALLTFAYGHRGARTLVRPLWLRACGADVRAQFRSLIAWDVLGISLDIYPRWLVEIDSETFTDVVG